MLEKYESHKIQYNNYVDLFNLTFFTFIYYYTYSHSRSKGRQANRASALRRTKYYDFRGCHKNE